MQPSIFIESQNLNPFQDICHCQYSYKKLAIIYIFSSLLHLNRLPYLSLAYGIPLGLPLQHNIIRPVRLCEGEYFFANEGPWIFKGISWFLSISTQTWNILILMFIVCESMVKPWVSVRAFDRFKIMTVIPKTLILNYKHLTRVMLSISEVNII